MVNFWQKDVDIFDGGKAEIASVLAKNSKKQLYTNENAMSKIFTKNRRFWDVDRVGVKFARKKISLSRW